MVQGPWILGPGLFKLDSCPPAARDQHFQHPFFMVLPKVTPQTSNPTLWFLSGCFFRSRITLQRFAAPTQSNPRPEALKAAPPGTHILFLRARGSETFHRSFLHNVDPFM